MNSQYQSSEDIDISSESSAAGGGIHDDGDRRTSNHQIGVFEIWNRNDIEMTLKRMSNIIDLIEIVNTKEFSRITGKHEMNNVLLIATWLNLPETVSQLLNEFSANPNASDFERRTPLHMACFNGNAILTQILLDHGASTHCWDVKRLISPLHCASSVGSVKCVQLLLSNGAKVNTNYERRSALHYAVQNNHTECVKLLLSNRADPNYSHCNNENPVHLAVALGHKECLKILIDSGADITLPFGKNKITALHIAAEEDYSECLKMLLDAKAPIDPRNVNFQTPLHLACLGKCTEVVDILIKRGANVHQTYKDGRTALHAAIVKESRDWDCARLLIRAGVNVNIPDNFGYTPLHTAALNEFHSCASLLLEHGADLTARTNGGISALSFVVRRTPQVISKFKRKIDESITVNENDIGDVDCEIKLDFTVLVPNANEKETKLLFSCVETGQKSILQHPLSETFLFLKWRRIRKFYLLILMFHIVHALLCTSFILGVYVKDCPYMYRMEQTDLCRNPAYIKWVGISVIPMNLILFIKALCQMAQGFHEFIRNWENWLQYCIILSMFLCIADQPTFTDNIRFLPDWRQHTAGLAIFFLWVGLMMIVGQFPMFGLYVQMFTKVAVNFSKFFLAYFCLLVAFGLSFAVLFSNHKPFEKIPWALLKIIVMMIGEIEYEDTFYTDDKILYPVTAHVIFLIFVLLVTIILTNLMVGLAVSDIRELEHSANLGRLIRQTELISRLESVFFLKLLNENVVPKRFYNIFRRSALLRTSPGRFQFCIRPNDPRENRLPKELIHLIFQFAVERRDRNQRLKLSRQQSYFPVERHIPLKKKSQKIKEDPKRLKAEWIAQMESNRDAIVEQLTLMSADLQLLKKRFFRQYSKV